MYDTLGWELWSLLTRKPSIFGERSERRSGAAGRAWPFHMHWNGHYDFDMACDPREISGTGVD